MVKKQVYKLDMVNGEEKEVKGEVYGSFGIHKREDGMFVLTHLPSGCRVVSANKKKELVSLVEDEEFSQPCWELDRPDKESISRLSSIISEYYGSKK